jgi:lysophospholipase L1-like esterase
VFAGIEGESRFVTNAFGIRGPDFGESRRKEYRILFLGGSATECFYLDQDRAWPAVTGQALGETADRRKVWAGNIGRSGHNSRDHVMEMRLLVTHLPVDAIVVTMGVNDLGLRLAQDRWFNPDFLATDENVAYQVKHAFSVRPDDPNQPFYKKGVVGRLLGLDPDVAKRKPHQIVDNAGLIFQKWRDYRRVGEMVSALPPMEAPLAEYARNIEEIARRAKEAGLRLVFATQPALWRAGLDQAQLGTLWMGGIGDYQEKSGAQYYTPEALAEGLALYNRTLMETCAKAGAECFDLAPLVPQDLSAFYDDCHFNDAGAAKVSEAFASYFRSRPPFTR